MAKTSASTLNDKHTPGARQATSQPRVADRHEVSVDARALDELVDALDAARRGDFSVRLSRRRKGVLGEVAGSFNDLVEHNERMTNELVRIARVIGREGRMTERAALDGAGGWQTSVDSINSLIGDLVRPTTEVGRVLMAVAEGDLSQEMALTIEGQPVKGEFLRIGTTVNTMVDQLSSFADEVTRVAREVGTEGKLGGQAEVEGVSGTWRDLTDNVNMMASNLTDQVRNIVEVTTAVAQGDLTQQITVDVKGEVLELKNTVNTMVDQLSSFADEVTRVAREVGTEGKLGGQAEVKGVSGTWRDLTESVNFMAGNLTDQVRGIADVTTAVANGDLSQKITVEAKGEVAVLADTINSMVDTLGVFAEQVTTVAREVGTEGKLGGQAAVPGVSGTWRDLTENVNLMASNLTDQVRNIAGVTTAVANGDLTREITVDVKGEVLELKNTVNTMVDQLSSFADEVTRVAREVGTEGKLGGQAQVEGVSGTWRDLTESVNFMAGNLTGQVRNIAEVTTAVANGDLSQKIAVDAKGEILELKDTINTMVDQLRAFAAEVTRVAKEVGTEGKLGGQAEVEGVSGTWRGLTENVNQLAGNLTTQVRNIAQVTTAVANGDLSKKITVEAKGEVAELADTINTMVDQLSSFADEVTRVAREVGTEGKLGGQAQVEGVSGTWRGLTDNVNQLAGNLTTQVRAIAEVSTSVTQGDLTRSIDVEAQGEVAELKDNINEMIANLRDTTTQNAEQDWLKTNLAGISGLMQGQRDLKTVSQLIMSELTPTVSAQLGAFFLSEAGEDPDERELRLIAGYGYTGDKLRPDRFGHGEGLVGQAALEKTSILISQPPANYLQVSSGLGSSPPANIIVLPITFEEQVLAVIELASFTPFSDVHLQFLEQLTETIGVSLNTIIANMRTEDLLGQSQSLTQELQSQSGELQSQQEELQQTNAELHEKAALLSQQNRDIEIKNREIEIARRNLEEKAEQLALSSRYKSEFLANMSHELRTPLNSLLILSKLLADNEDRSLSEKQVEYAGTIHSAGSDLLSLINDILDLSKVEAGKMEVRPAPVILEDVRDYVERGFRPVAEEKGLAFEVELGPELPRTVTTDEQRLQQVLKNLLSNAFKFTGEGGVTLRLAPAPDGRIAFTVADTGVGIPADKLRLIFEAFQQGEGGMSRKYGGTGLGLSISREIARLLGGELDARSGPGEGSEFTLLLPVEYVPVDTEPVTLSETAPDLVAATVPAKLTNGRPPAEAVDEQPSLTPADRALLEGRKVLLVDDDVRNVFALASLLEARGMEVLFAENGRDAIETLRESPEVDLMLMDIMMPEMDGHEAVRRIREMDEFKDLPIVALTAKAMQGDREKSLLAGASDYVAKPVDSERLLSLMRVWLQG